MMMSLMITNNTDDDVTEDVEIAALLKYLGSIWKNN